MAGERREPGEEDGILGAGASRGGESETVKPDGEPKEKSEIPQADLSDPELLNDPNVFEQSAVWAERRKTPLPVSIIFQKIHLFYEREQRINPKIRTSTERARLLHNLSADTKENLCDRVENSTENDWQKRPSYYCAVMLEWKSRV